jgi:hypothetical protein
LRIKKTLQLLFGLRGVVYGEDSDDEVGALPGLKLYEYVIRDLALEGSMQRNICMSGIRDNSRIGEALTYSGKL